MSSRSRHSLCCALALILPTGAVAQHPPVESLLATDSALAVRTSSGIAGLVAFTTPDVVLLHDSAPVVRGRDALVAVVDSLASRTHDRLTWTALRADVSADGTRGYTYGRGVRTVQASERDGGRNGTRGVRYAAWWRREGGAWRVAALLLVDERAAKADPADTSTRWPCTSVTPAVVRRSTDAAREVVAADAAFAARSLTAGPAVAFAEYAADDGVSLGGGSVPACGKHAIGAQLDGAAPSDLLWAPVVGDAAASGDLGYTVGTATIRGAHGVRYSKYLTIWKRQPDGTWRFVADGGSAAPARQRALAVR